MSETEGSSRADENTSSNCDDDHKLLQKKKRKNRQKNHNVKSDSISNTNENHFLPVQCQVHEINVVDVNGVERNTSLNEDNVRSTDVNLIDTDFTEDSGTARCGCFGKMFKYIKRKLFKNETSSPETKRSKLNDNKAESSATSSTTQSSNKIESNSNRDVNSSDFLVQKVIVEPEPQLVNNDSHSSQFVESEEIIVSNEIDEIQQAQPAQKRKRNRRKKKLFDGSEIDTNNDSTEMPEEIKNNPKLKKYWKNRYRLFSRYDEGIKLDAESWYSVTPEKISIEIARRCQCDVIIDAFCGAGGNTIQFAFICERVIAIDIDAEKIKLAKHNAEIYGVADRIEFIIGDFFQVAPDLTADVVFLSPPWGGPSYNDVRELSLSQIMEPHGGKHLYNVAKQISDHIAYFLPRNINIPEVAFLEPDDYVKVDRNYLGDRLIAITAYFGDLIEDYGDEWNN